LTLPSNTRLELIALSDVSYRRSLWREVLAALVGRMCI
jgi:hypothetical protein